jgi:adhesin/invasin
MSSAWTRWVFRIALLGIVASGCTAPVEGMVNPEPTPEPTIEIVSGSDQSADVGSALALPFIAIVKDSNAVPMPGVSVTFEVTSGGGALSATTATTDDMGQAQTTLTVGNIAGTNTVTASASGVRESVTFSAIANTPTAVMYSTHVKPIIEASCVGCHQAGGAALFTPLTSFAVVRYGVSSTGGAPLVVAGDAAASVLMQKLQPTATMYASLGADAATREANAKTINDWIAAGALNTEPGLPAKIVVLSGNNQSTTVSTALPSPLTVRIMDENDNPLAGVWADFAVTSGGGALSPKAAKTDALGVAKTSFILGATTGANSVSASVIGVSTPVTFASTGTAGTATQIALVSGNNQTATVGTRVTNPLVVGVKDANGNPVSGFMINFTIATGDGSVSAETVLTNAQGQAQTLFTVGTTAGANSVRVNATGLSGSPVTFTATGTAGTATNLALVSGNNQSATVGTALSAPFIVAVTDTYGNPIANTAVTFAVASGGGTLSATSATTNAAGQASTRLTVGATAGMNTVTATRAGLTGSPITFTATGTTGTATQIALVSGNNQSATVGSTLNPFVVAVKDANGNPVMGFSVTFTVTAGGGSVSAATAMTNAQGQAQSTLTLGGMAGANTVTANATGLTGSPITFTATGTTGAAAQLAIVSGNNQTGKVSTALASPFVVSLKDSFGNPVSGAAVTFAVTSGGGTLSGTSATTNATGLAQVTLTLGASAGTNTVTASRTGLTPVTFTASATSGAASQIAIVSGNNQSAAISRPLAMPLVVVVKDSAGNPISGVSVAFAVTGGGGSLSTSTAMSSSTGQAQTQLTVGGAPGPNTVTATVSGLSPITFTAVARYLTYTDDVQPILVARCVSCHMAGGQASFTPLTTYTQVHFGVSFSSSAPLVVPNSPTTSLLVTKTQSSGSMYSQLGADTATRDANAKTINDWVAQGALNSSVGAASQIVMTSGNGQSGAINATLTNPFVVTVMDSNLNPVSGVTVTFAVTAGGGTLSATTVATSAQGTAASTLKLGPTATTNTVTASAAGLTNSPITFSATATASYSGAPLTGSTNPFDVAALVALKAANVEPVALSSDGEFLRRVTADLAGRLPTLDEWNTFAASTDPAKRDQAIDRLLASSEFGTHWGLDILAAWLVVDKADDNVTTTDIANFEAYLINAANTDKPLSTVVSELAQGMGTGGAAFDVLNMHQYDRYKAVDRLMETFTGIPVKCARCHDSKITTPLDDPKWTLAQSHGLYKFFEVDSGEFNYFDPVHNKYVNPTMMFVVDGVATNPSNLPLPTDTLAVRRARFAQLLVASKAFPRGTGHRIFAEVMDPLLDSNRVLAQPLASVKVPEVLKACSTVFTNQGTSLKGYLRTLMRSKLYQLTTKGTTTANDNILARRTLRRHAAETLEAGIVGVTGIADTASQKTDFLDKFGYAMDRSSITERSFSINTIQPLTLLNNPSSAPGKVTQTAGIIAGLATKVDGGTMTLDAAITEIFRRALTRDPTSTELTSFKTELSTAATTKEKLEDVAVVVMASTEFANR